METIRREGVLAALLRSSGSIADAAALLGVRRHELATRISRDPELRQYHMDFVESAIDKAQQNVFQAVANGDYAASQFVLTTLGKGRGFSTKQELSLVKEEALSELSEAELEEKLRRAQERLTALLDKPNSPKAIAHSEG